MTADGVTHITDDIVQVQIPLPYALNIVNCYLLRGDGGWTLVDTGLNTPPAQAQWTSALNQLHIAPDDIDKIILTHMHPDHFGMAGWWQRLVERPMPLYIPELEKPQAQYFYNPRNTARYHQWLLACGVDQVTIDEVEGALGSTRDATRPHPLRQDYLAAESVVRIGKRDFRAIHAPGHSDGQLIFYDSDDRLMLCGDHVLMKITPNIGAWQHSQPNPLRRFLDSLTALLQLDVRLALPGHKWLISDWRGRIEELLDHHDQRLGHTLDAIAGGATTVREISMVIFPFERFTPHEWRFAMAEALAHLQLLGERGQVTQLEGEVYRFRLN
ncbi:MAG: MBL fold metallo-hydrolase [Chloroflexi bacterium]|nr:MBL fold metallo-hydrolase [Chloroflexota bacterium]